MYYVLNENIRMCGWDLLETGLVEVKTNRVMFMQPNLYKLIFYCDGQTDFDTLSLDDEQKEMIDELVSKEVIKGSETKNALLKDWQKYKRYNNRLMKAAHWSITGRCNYRCKHCYMSAPSGMLGELSFDDCKSIIDQMAEVGLLSVSLTGGEAMVHPRFWDIVDLLIEKNIRISEIYSNGFLINDAFFENCKKRRIKPQISLSFDGLGGAHEWLRGVDGADEHIKNAIRLINENKFKYNVEMCLYQKSIGVFRESVRFLNENGCSALKVNALSVIGEGTQISDQAVDREELYKLYMDYIPMYKEDGITMSVVMCNTLLTPKGVNFLADKHVAEDKAGNYCLCGHARNSMYITCKGSILPCIPYSENPEREKDFPNVLNTPLREILITSKYFDVITKTLAEFLSEHEECAECEHKYSCVGGCPGKAVISTKPGDPDGKDEEMCWYYKNGMNTKIKEISDKVFVNSIDEK